ncbi:hypothetical protein PAXINDRAFT_11819 [Paxillus involutus ATCC 200175]|uniref:Uncharacterized protein n=1 Tax=Paxillus involutus ATCC 200175 TaxID=664439 RepID=A0A0C9THX9_PAXIN|nr:hypothetical protein PAXINDRAFT_11819 [Paxillus involutus ATCC 200175]
MGLCDNFWKVDTIATARYSSWTQTHLKESNKRKVNTKSEPPEELSSPKPDTKKIKADSDLSIPLSTSPMDLNTSVPSSSLHNFSKSSTTSTTSPPCTSPFIFKNAIILPASDNVLTVETITSASDTGSVTIPEVKNPLKILLKRKGIEMLSMVSISDTTLMSMSNSTTSEHHSKMNETSSKGHAEEPTSSTSVEQPTVAKKWQPQKMKSARTLCAHHWLRQVNEDRSTTQFNKY